VRQLGLHEAVLVSALDKLLLQAVNDKKSHYFGVSASSFLDVTHFKIMALSKQQDKDIIVGVHAHQPLTW